MIDYFFLFTNEAAALADTTIGTYASKGVWRGDLVFPNVAWSSSDTLTGWMMMIASPAADAKLSAHSKCILALDRGKAAASQSFVVSSAGLTTNGRTSFMFSPVPAGSAYPRPLAQ